MLDAHSSSNRTIKNIVVVGGGLAGWMSAAALARSIEPSVIGVTLVESDDIGAVGGSVATLPAIRTFNALLGLTEDEFIRHSQSTCKLGTEFVGWRAPGSRYVHHFGGNGLYGFHVDAGLYAAYLRIYCEARGVRRLEGRIAHVRRRREDGFISRLVLRDGRTVEGDLFLDCSGLRSLLIARSLEVGFEDWSQWLPCDRLVAAACEALSPLPSYTRSTADVAGWRWRMPLQNRTGNGYVYCSRFSSDVAAQARLLAQLDATCLGDVSLLRFTTGHRQRFWEKNCVAIGSAGGFIEPLEPTAVYLIQEGIGRLLVSVRDRHFTRGAVEAYNRYMMDQYRRIRDFVILHYHARARGDTPFWRHCRGLGIPESLQERIERFRRDGVMLQEPEDPFGAQSWIAVMLGQGITPAPRDRAVSEGIPSAGDRAVSEGIPSAGDRAVSEGIPSEGDRAPSAAAVQGLECS
jgi:tryptophan halogenase